MIIEELNYLISAETWTRSRRSVAGPVAV